MVPEDQKNTQRPQRNHVGERLFLNDDVTNGGDASLSEVFYCDSKVGNACWEQYICSHFNN